jgi:glycosyltransferase involved in cell wall biosynthesis
MFFVIPSIAEGFPGGLVTLEAMASGLPILASKIEGIESVVKDGYNGFLFELGDIKKLRYYIIHLCEDQNLRKVMGIRSRNIAENKFSWGIVAKRTLQLYEDTLHGK